MSIDKKIITAIILLAFLFSLCTFSPVQAAGEKKELRAYVLYDDEFRFGSGASLPVFLGEYLGHFDLDQRTLAVSDWKPGDLRDADIVFFIGLRNEPLPHGLLEEIARAKRVVWFERNIGQLAALLNWRDFSYEGARDGWTSVSSRFGDRSVPGWMRFVATAPGLGAEVYRVIKNIDEQRAFSWRRDNVYYLACLDFFAPAVKASLVEILARAIPAEYARSYSQPRKMLLRIEDVSPLTQAGTVSRIVDAIAGYGIPYAIGVISLGVAEDGRRTALHERPDLVKVLQRAQAGGASIIMHGYSHENEFSPKTGEGWEFWNAKKDKPMENDEAFTRERIEKVFLELARCGLYPVAFEPPHYAMSKKGYEVLSQYFNIYSGQPQISDETDSVSLSYPYIVKSPYLNGMIVVPENMGYFDSGESRAEDLLQKAGTIHEMDDSFACFFYHGYLPSAEPLREVIEGAQRQGYSFFDLRTMAVRAGSPQVEIVVSGGQVSARIDPSLSAKWKEETAKKGFRLSTAKLGWMQVCVLLVAIAAIVGMIIRLKRTAWKKYEVH